MSSMTVSFDGGLRTLAGFLFMTVAALVLSRYQWPLVPTIPIVDVDVLALLIDLSLLGTVWWALKREGVSLETLGISTTLVVPGVVAVVGFYVALNLVAATLAPTTVGTGALGYQWTTLPLQAGITFLSTCLSLPESSRRSIQNGICCLQSTGHPNPISDGVSFPGFRNSSKPRTTAYSTLFAGARPFPE